LHLLHAVGAKCKRSTGICRPEWNSQLRNSQLHQHSEWCLTSMTVCAGRPSVPPAAAAARSPAVSRGRLCGVGRLRAPAELLAGSGLAKLLGTDSGGLLLARCCCGCCCWQFVRSDPALLRLLPATAAAAGLRELPPQAALPELRLLLLALCLAPPLAPPRGLPLPALFSTRPEVATVRAAAAAALPAGGAVRS
jgi:hypothetical protein